MRTLVLVAALVAFPSAAFAQADPSPQWLPWIGCWQSAAERVAGDDARLCVVPIENGVGMESVIGDQISPLRTITGDDSAGPSLDPACTGSERLEWGARTNMFFTRQELICGTQPRRTVTGLHLFTAGPTWLDIQVVEGIEGPSVRARRYERMSVPDLLSPRLGADLVARATAASQHLAATPLSVDDVVEATRKVATAGIDAMLFETRTKFALDSRALVSLKDAGVEERVIDLMLAISYPRHFAVDRQGAAVPPLFFEGDPAWDDYYWGVDGFRHSSLFGPLGYYDSGGYYSQWRIRYFPRGDSPAFEAANDGGSDPSASSSSSSKAVKGQGYTRNSSKPSNSGSAGGADGASTRGAGGGDSRGGGSSDSGGNASSGGYSSGSSGDGGGRTAVDRD